MRAIKIMAALFVGLIMFFVLIAACTAAITPDDDATTTTVGIDPVLTPPPGVDTDPTPEAKPAKLTQQARFMALVDAARTEADKADNDFRRRLALTNRNKAICQLLDSKKIKNWSATVTELNTNGDGLGVLTLKIGDDTQVGTWNNALSDLTDHTLIDTDSAVFKTMGTLVKGDQVTFSGTFISDDKSCVSEQSITDDGAAQSPTFTFRFSDLTLR